MEEGTFAHPDDSPPLTLESLSAIMRNFTDRRPAPVKRIEVHPDYFEVFMGNLHEEGFERRQPTGLEMLTGIPITCNEEVPYGEHRLIYL